MRLYAISILDDRNVSAGVHVVGSMKRMHECLEQLSRITYPNFHGYSRPELVAGNDCIYVAFYTSLQRSQCRAAIAQLESDDAQPNCVVVG